eukprot:3147117-Prymnesium_polylepis.1
MGTAALQHPTRHDPRTTCHPHDDPHPLVEPIVLQQRTLRLAPTSRGTASSPAREQPAGRRPEHGQA